MQTAPRFYLIIASFVSVTLTLAALPLLAFAPHAPSTSIVIRQIYGGGGNAGAPYQNDFIELFNRGNISITLNGWSLQYAPATSAAWSATNLTGTLAPGQSFLIKQSSGGANGMPLPTADVTGTINLSATAGKVALVNSTTLLAVACPLPNANIIDLVGYGTTANCSETAPAPAPSNTNAILRAANGCTETDNNATDFATGAPVPRNTASPVQTCTAPSTSTFTPTATATSTPTFTPTSTTTPTATATRIAERLLISEVIYDGIMTDEGDEAIELFNPLNYSIDAGGYKVGDEETKGGGEGMYVIPNNTLMPPNGMLIIARNAAQFRNRFGFDPHFEIAVTGALTDTLGVPNLVKYSAWATGSMSLSNTGDEVLLLGPGDQFVDAVAWENGDFASVGLRGSATALEPQSLQRYGTTDTNSMTFDFLHGAPSPGIAVMPPTFPTPPLGVAIQNGMNAYWGDLHSHSTASDGSGPPRMAFATARANGLHFFAVTDHDAWLDAEEWNEIGAAATSANRDNEFVALRGFEYTHRTQGHVNVFGTDTFVSRDDANYDTLTKFFDWLGAQTNAVAQFNHPDPKYDGDFNSFAFHANAASKIFLQEVGNNAQGYFRYEPQFAQSHSKGWRAAPSINSDNHALTWGNDSNHRVGVIMPALTQANLFDALRARRVFATEDKNLAIALQAQGAWMGSTITAQSLLVFTITLDDPDNEPVDLVLYDNGAPVRAQSFTGPRVAWNVTVRGNAQHFYFVRAQQRDGDIAYTAPIWTDNTPVPTPVLPTETPRPKTWDVGDVSVDTARTTGLYRYANVSACVSVPPGLFSNRYMYIQDDTGGIRLNLAARVGEFPAIALNDRIVVRGRIENSGGERVLDIEDVSTLQVQGKCATPNPPRYATGKIAATLFGSLVEIAGNVISTNPPYEFVVSDGSGDALIYIDATTRLRMSQITRGQRVRVVGIVSQARNRLAVLPRYAEDMVILSAPSTPTRTLANRTATPTWTRLSTVAPTPTLAAAATRTSTPRALMETTRVSAGLAPLKLDATAMGVAGAAALTFSGLVLWTIGIVLWRRAK